MKRTLSKRMGMALVLLSFVIILNTDIFLALVIRIQVRSIYKEEAYSYTRAAASLIYGDSIERYLETQEIDDYYLEIHEYLHVVKDNSDVLHMYVTKPGDHGLIYIWDADVEVGKNEIGYTEKYGANALDQVELSFRQDPEEVLGVYREGNISVATAVSPIFDSQGNPVALVGIDMSMPALSKVILNAIIIITLGIVIIMLISLAFYFSKINKDIIQPIVSLTRATEEFVGNLDSENEFHSDIKTGDEIEALSKSFEKMDIELREYIKDNMAITAEKERIGTELNVATSIQLDMMPSIFPIFTERTDIDINAIIDPAREVGGDFYDFFFIDDNNMAIVVADVSGKGVPAALFMVIAKTLIKNQAQLGINSAEDILRNVNNQLCDSNELAMFVTVYLAIIDLSTGKGVVSNAGHEHPMLRHKGGEFDYVKYEHSTVVGVIPGMEYPQHEITLEKGDTLFLYTDGVLEATDSKDQAFGEDRLKEVLNRDPEASLEDLLDTVKEEIDSFVGDAPQFDDITMLAFTYLGGN